MCGTHNDIFLGGEFLIRQVSIKVLWRLVLAMMVSAAFKRLPFVSMKVIVWAGLLSTGLSLWDSGCMVLFRILDRLICVTLSLNGSTSMLMTSKSVSDLDGCVAIFWLCWLGVDTIMGCWIFVVDELLYRKSLLVDSDSGKRSVGVDVLCVGGGVFFGF